MAGAWLAGLLGASPAWVAATANPPAKVIVREVWAAARGLLAHVFWTSPFAGGTPATALRALADGVLAGLGQGLPVSGLGQAFAWPYLLGWPNAALPGLAPALWCAGLLGAALGLALLLRREWSGLAGRRGDSEPAPGWTSVVAAAVPAFLVRWLLRHLTIQLEAAATVGLCLAASGELVRLFAVGARRAEGRAAQVPPWLAALAGLASGAAALPGLSMLAVLLLAGLYARAAADAAARFALMAAALASALLGLFAAPAAVGALSAGAALVLVGSALGAFAGGWCLLRWVGAAPGRALPVLASYSTALGGVLLLLGVFNA